MLELLRTVQPYSRSDTTNPREMLQRISDLTERHRDTDPTPAYADRFCQHTMNILIYSSNKFEGSTLTKGQTMRILNEFASRGEAAIRDALSNEPCQMKRQDPPARREVLQHFLAVQQLCSQPTLPLTEEAIKRAHALLTEGLLDDDGEDVAPGQYRTQPISAKGRPFMEAENVPASMALLVKDFNSLATVVMEQGVSLDTCLIASWLMVEFLTIHPFNDGNGRVARLLFNYALRLFGFPFYVTAMESGAGRSDYLAGLKAYQKFPKWERERRHQKFGTIWVWAAASVETAWSGYFTNLEYVQQ